MEMRKKTYLARGFDLILRFILQVVTTNVLKRMIAAISHVLLFQMTHVYVHSISCWLAIRPLSCRMSPHIDQAQFLVERWHGRRKMK